MLVEVGIGFGITILFALVRLALVPWTGEAAPYALVFAAVAGATVLAGWRSGLIALLLGQALSWIYATEPFGSLVAKNSAQVWGLLLATFSQLVLLVIIALYQREVERASSRRESQVGLLEKALAEIDHRTSNNYQTILALVLAQAKNAQEASVKNALQQVADRIRAVANASRRLAVASESLEQVRIAEHLQDLCEEIEKGLSRPGIRLDCRFEEIVIGADETVCVSILVNELVTNALKHAFPGDRSGTIRVALDNSSSGSIELRVEDDGVGMIGEGGPRGSGLGTRLVETFVRQLGAKHHVSSGKAGTRHRIRFRK